MASTHTIKSNKNFSELFSQLKLRLLFNYSFRETVVELNIRTHGNHLQKHFFKNNFFRDFSPPKCE